MFLRGIRRTARRGLSAVQVGMVLAFVGLVAIVGMNSLGDRASSDLSLTAQNVADPASLVNRFDGSQCNNSCSEDDTDGGPGDNDDGGDNDGDGGGGEDDGGMCP